MLVATVCMIMTNQEQALRLLRETGIRLTPQRMFILSAVANGRGHMGVDEIFTRAKKTYPYMDIATVYRTLHLFAELGVVTEVAMEDRLHFELTDPNGRHHHMVCKQCGGAFDLSPHYLEEFRNTIIEEFGFEPDLDNFTVSGVCTACSRRPSHRSRRA